MVSTSNELLDEMLDTELDNLGIFATSNLEGMSQIDKDRYIESLLLEIRDLKNRLNFNTIDINENGLEELANIDAADLNETITLKSIDQDDDDNEGDVEGDESFNQSDILNMLGSFMNNDMLGGNTGGDNNQSTGNPIDNPMFKLLSKMMEGMNENVQTLDEEEIDSDASVPSHEKVE